MPGQINWVEIPAADTTRPAPSTAPSSAGTPTTSTPRPNGCTNSAPTAKTAKTAKTSARSPASAGSHTATTTKEPRSASTNPNHKTEYRCAARPPGPLRPSSVRRGRRHRFPTHRPRLCRPRPRGAPTRSSAAPAALLASSTNSGSMSTENTGHCRGGESKAALYPVPVPISRTRPPSRTSRIPASAPSVRGASSSGTG